jgi:large subunit ribosomal protein L13
MTMSRTYTPRASEIERQWFLVDADGETLGRLASRVSRLLAGKHKPGYATHIDTGDHVVVINASKVAVSRNKLSDKVYARHSGYPGGFREETLGDLLARRPEEVIRRAVKGMLPRNTLGVQQLRKLKIYAGGEHPHEAQQPSELASDRRSPAAAASRAAGGEAAPAKQEASDGRSPAAGRAAAASRAAGGEAAPAKQEIAAKSEGAAAE